MITVYFLVEDTIDEFESPWFVCRYIKASPRHASRFVAPSLGRGVAATSEVDDNGGKIIARTA